MGGARGGRRCRKVKVSVLVTQTCPLPSPGSSRASRRERPSRSIWPRCEYLVWVGLSIPCLGHGGGGGWGPPLLPVGITNGCLLSHRVLVVTTVLLVLLVLP